MASTCRWFAPTVTARQPTRMGRGPMAIRRVHRERQKTRRQVQQKPNQLFLRHRAPTWRLQPTHVRAQRATRCNSTSDSRCCAARHAGSDSSVHRGQAAGLHRDSSCDLRVPRDPSRDLPEKAIPADYRLLTPPQWVAERTAEAEQLLWRKTCKQCHTLIAGEGAALPKIAPSNITSRYMPHAQFDHSQHGLVDCTSCHAAASTSQQSSDVLLPGIATCRSCHRAGDGSRRIALLRMPHVSRSRTAQTGAQQFFADGFGQQRVVILRRAINH